MIKFEIREMVETTKGNRMEVTAEFPEFAERTARLSYQEIIEANPTRYFELIRVSSVEQCLAFTQVGRITQGSAQILGPKTMNAMSKAKFEEIKECIEDKKTLKTNAVLRPLGLIVQLVEYCEVLIEEVEANEEELK